MTQVYIVQGEHWNVPGQAMSAHATIESANKEAVSLVAIMCKDLGLTCDLTPENWEEVLMKQVHGKLAEMDYDEDDANVWITTLEVKE